MMVRINSSRFNVKGQDIKTVLPVDAKCAQSSKNFAHDSETRRERPTLAPSGSDQLHAVTAGAVASHGHGTWPCSARCERDAPGAAHPLAARSKAAAAEPPAVAAATFASHDRNAYVLG